MTTLFGKGLRKSIASFGDPRALAAAIACITISGFSISLSFPLLSLVMESRGETETLIGLNTATAGFAALFAAPFAAPLAGRLGATPLLIAAILTCAICLMLLPFTPTWAWFPIRFVFTMAATFTFVIAEFWINSSADESRRGVIMGVYASMLSAGFAAGPAVLAITGSDGIAPFIVGIAAFVLSTIPVWIARDVAPAVHDAPTQKFIAFLWIAPAATLAAFVFGAVEQTSFAFLALFGLRSGLAEYQSALLLTMMGIGNLMFQIPLGLLADRYNRALLLFGCSLVGVAGMIALPIAIAAPLVAYAVVVVWGGITGGLYTIGLTHLGSRFRGIDLASANAMFVMMYALGMIVGPAIGGVSMQTYGPKGLAWFLAALFAGYAVIAAWRGVTRPTKPAA
ncbi:MAG: MFS transporter [Tepidamorphaceae bacterium]